MKNSIAHRNTSLGGILEYVNNAPAGIAFIVEDGGKLCGVITDGDIRRLLLDGHQLGEALPEKVLKSFVYATQEESLNELIVKADNKARIIPIVNNEDDFRIVDYFQYDKRVHVPVATPDLTGNELKYLTDAFLSTWISSAGEYINRFENQFASFCGTEYGVATSNGTTAIHLALDALNVREGDEVIVPDLTFAATINAVLYTRATPVVVDVETDSWCIDPAEIEKVITPKTKAIIPVHIYGQPCNMEAIMDIANKHNLYVIEDCAEAHGATFKGKKVGSFGHINTFSFFANKIITTGEGGICLTNDKELNDKMRVLRDHGMNKNKRYWHDVIGYNYRMTNMQAAVGCAQMERIDDIITYRDELEASYREILKDLDFIQFQPRLKDRRKTVWLVSALIEEDKRQDFIDFYKSHSIDIRPFFFPLSQMDLYKKYSFSYEVSHQLSKTGISFPTHKNVHLDKFRKVTDLYLQERLCLSN